MKITATVWGCETGRRITTRTGQHGLSSGRREHTAAESIGRVTDEARALWDARRRPSMMPPITGSETRSPWAWADLLRHSRRSWTPSRRSGMRDGHPVGLLAVEGGHFVSGVDFSPEMVRRLGEGRPNRSAARLHRADVANPPLRSDIRRVLSRHVLWAMPIRRSVDRWVELLTPRGADPLEGRWHTGVGGDRGSVRPAGQRPPRRRAAAPAR